MKAVVLEKYGGVEELRIMSVPDPKPEAQELLIKVHSTALNRADILQRMGLYPAPPSKYEILDLNSLEQLKIWVPKSLALVLAIRSWES